jgi:hypothetical protein
MRTNKVEIMGFKKFIKHYLLGESVKEMELNRILDKVSKKQKIEDREKKFLDLYNSTSDEEMRDFMYLSKNETFNKIKGLLNKGYTVVCDLYDRNGKIGIKIDSIENDFDNEVCIMTLKNDETHNLHDKFLYNIIYNNKKDIYSLQAQDEYHELIPVKNSNGNED